MGCPCREIRQVISHIPGVKHLLQYLPDLPNEGRSDMEMKTQPGRSIQVTSGTRYTADDKGIIHNVLAEDSADLRSAGCYDYNPTPQKPLPPAEHAPKASPQAVDEASPRPAVGPAAEAPAKKAPAAQ